MSARSEGRWPASTDPPTPQTLLGSDAYATGRLNRTLSPTPLSFGSALRDGVIELPTSRTNAS